MIEVLTRRIATTLLAYRKLPLKWQLALLLLIGMPFIWIPASFEFRQLRDISEYESRRDVHNLTLAFSEEVSSSISIIDLSLVGLRSHWQLNHAAFPQVVARLQDYLETNIIFQIAVTDATGKLIYSSIDPHPRPIDLSDREHIRVHLADNRDKLFISSPVLGRVSRKWSVQFTRPVYTADGRFDGVMIASVEPAYFSRFHRTLDLGRDASVAVTTSSGVILARSPGDGEDKGIGMVLVDPPYRSAAGHDSGFFVRVSQVDGVQRLFGWRALPRHGLVVVVGQSTAEAAARYGMEREAYLLVALVTSALLAAIGYAVLSVSRQRAVAAANLADSETRWKFALEGAGDGVWDWDLQHATVKLTQRSREILQLDDGIVTDPLKTLLSIVHPDDIADVRAALQTHLDGKTPSYALEHRVRKKNGAWRWILSRGMAVERDRNGRPLRMVGTFSDITERKSKEELIRHMAQHDALTDLPNRTLFNDRLQQSLLRAKRDGSRLGIVYFDLDKFKPVNDTYGHEVGDLLLKAVGTRIRQSLRATDTIARVGGDEFVVLLPAINSEADAVAVAENILRLLNTPFEVEGHALSISGSLGVATYPVDGGDSETLVRCADLAMYQAKEAGRNRVLRFIDDAAA